MNWSTLLRFRKQVEDVVREEVTMAELEKDHEELKRRTLQGEMDQIAVTLDQSLQSGVNLVFAEQRFRWLEESGEVLERQASRILAIDTKICELKKRLRQAHHSRRVVEIVISKKEEAYIRRLAQQEQKMMEEAAAHKHTSAYHEEL